MPLDPGRSDAMLEEAFALPDEGEATYLLAGLARLIAVRGADTFLSAPILLPEPRFWPDAVGTRGDAAATLLRRLLVYAGLGHLGVEIEIGGSPPPDIVSEGEDDESGRHAAGWFYGIEDEVCRFGVSSSSLRDEESLIGTLGHEVAHAYREHHALYTRDRDTEEKLTDLTTIYLGFGAFTLQSSYQFKTGHYDEQGRQLLYERRVLGYLTPGQLALLLAAQLAVRADGKVALAAALQALSPNPAQALKRAYASLSSQRDALIGTLRLPPRETWPAPRELSACLLPLGPATTRVIDHVADERDRQRQVAFRVRRDARSLFCGGGVALGMFSFLVDGVGGWMWPLCAAFGVAGYQLGRRFASAACSGCHRSVAIAAESCAFCASRLVGTIPTQEDRLEAEERYWDNQASSEVSNTRSLTR